MIARLVVFGCSHTEGQFLPGWKAAIGDSSTVYSPHSWASLLGAHLNVPVDNMGRGGNSNHEILIDVLNYNFQPDDLAVICWSYPERAILFSTSTLRQLERSRDLLDRDSNDLFYRAHDLYDLEVRTVEHINYANLYLSSKRVNYQMSWIQKVEVNNTNIRTPDTSNFPFFKIVDLGTDNNHPGVLSHAKFFDQIVKTLNV
jgi:hypothetical protein